MITVEVIEYIRPNGRKKIVYPKMPDTCQEGINQIKKNNLELTAELIGPNEVCLTITNVDYGDYKIEIAKNCIRSGGPTATLKKLILDFNEEDYKKWLKREEDMNNETPNDERIPF